MATYRIKLSDGTTTLDFYGSDYRLVPGGLTIPKLDKDISRSEASENGQKIYNSQPNNRFITLAFHVMGTSKSDLKTNVNALESLLQDARERRKAGFGTMVYLEYQWGDTAGQSVYYDILDGELQLPEDFHSNSLRYANIIENATIILECKPYARYTNQNLPQDTLENRDYSTSHNYKDILATTLGGNAPAPAFIKLNPSGASGTKNTYVAKRSGSRYNDDLWTEGEAETSVTAIVESPDVIANSDENEAACSAGKFKRVIYNMVGGTSPADGTLLSRINYDLTTPPQGLFRLLARCRVGSVETGESANLAFAAGYSYGNVSKTPTKAKYDFKTLAALDTWELLDLGLIRIPPIKKSDIAGNSTFQLRIYQAIDAALSHITPTASSGTSWFNVTFVRDGDVATYSSYSNPGGTTNPLVVSHNAVYSSGVRYYYDLVSGNLSKITVEAYYGAAWHTLFDDIDPPERTWQFVSIGATPQYVSDYRITFALSGTSTVGACEMEFVPAPVFDLDYICLLPTDEGYAIINSGASDIIALDSISENPEIYIVDASNKVLQVASAVGAPFTLGRENTRIYVLRDDVPAVTFATDVKYQPRYKTV